MLKLKFTTLVAAGTLMALAGAAVAQPTPMPPNQMQQTQSGMSALSASEQQFLTKNATDGVYEFISAQLAV